ncbi:metallophosphatase [Flavobacterium akiainvivens]|uniref:Metallophosphatase n=1 Tax=Flavobacterium akiainvivens TaxID=1202724 RepID=A0A0M8MHG5_9FLAO|nr:metallophosphoesterase [Flavobacterium akiainvivens]KOS05867.1 metallophosphatase [Flavobacterium akiainvivens]SFQ56556.1 Calcineurin-like phosphoesterase [Flavobacterium akiainvivens]
MRKFFSLLLISFIANAQTPDVKIAFLADVHLQDLYGRFSDNPYRGVLNPADGKYVLLRTMDAQLHSTRIFNENYFAFIAALDDIAKRGIKIVALPGDYTDDGQRIHLKGLQKILNSYSEKYGIQFFITTGNHDPVRPGKQDAGKDDFLGEGGKVQPIFSKEGMYTPKQGELPVVVTTDIAQMGYSGIYINLGNFDFLPKEQYKYWASPFSNYAYEEYTYNLAVTQSRLDKRMYEVAKGFYVSDASYVVETVEGVWLLAIDGNTYIPVDENGNPMDQKNYKGADLGYNNVLTHKQYLFEWVAKVSAEAKKHNKTLVAFSHYPMVDFNDGASPQIAQFMGKGKWQLNRVPVEEIAQRFADAGITLHFGGHMHINDTGIYTSPKGNTLLNVQTPSLAAYIPGYKLLTLHDNTAEVETITIDDVPGFDTLFQLYEMEYAQLQKEGRANIWNHDILKTKSYHEFTDFHLKELVRLRFIPDDWYKEFAGFLKNSTGQDLLLIANMQGVDYKAVLDSNKDSKTRREALKTAKKELKKSGMKLADFKWSGEELMYDFYRIRSADELALADIGQKRLAQYKLIMQCILNNTSADYEGDIILQDFKLFFTILDKFLKGDPANHFTYDLKTSVLTDVKE